MQPGTIVQFLKALGCHDASPQGGWVTCKCPLAFWTHKTGKDSTPSFGVRIDSGFFNCFACGKGSLETLLGTLELYLPKAPDLVRARFNIPLAREVLQGAAGEVDVLPPYEEAVANQSKVFEPWPDWVLNGYTPAHLHKDSSAYLNKRGLDLLEVTTYGLRFDVGRQMVIFPFRNHGGYLAGGRGRCINPEFKVQHYDYKHGEVNNTALTFLGEDCVPEAVEKHRPLILVEGQFDWVAVKRFYPYVLGNLTAMPTPEKLQLLNSCPDGVVTMLDNDETGYKARKEWEVGLHVPVGRLDYPEAFKDPDSMPRPLLAELIGQFVKDLDGE